MPSFGEPSPSYPYHLNTAKTEVDAWFTHRQVPGPKNGKLLIATWNIANLGEQKRDPKDLKLIAHILKRVELIAVQEVKTNYEHFAEVVEHMGDQYEWIINDPGGNSERLAFIYNTDKVWPGRLFGEVAIPAKDFPKRTVVVPYRKGGEDRVEVYYNHQFTPFDRNPFVGTFETEHFDFTIANVHLYFGKFRNSPKQEDRAKYARRVLEIYTLGKWAKKRMNSDKTYDRDILLMGDMNIPKMEAGDSAYEALLDSGFTPLRHDTSTGGVNEGGTNLAGDKTYDQVAMTPGSVTDRVLKYDSFDFDNGIFRGKWQELSNSLNAKKAASKFNSYVKFYVSDHRPIWMQLDITSQ